MLLRNIAGPVEWFALLAILSWGSAVRPFLAIIHSAPLNPTANPDPGNRLTAKFA